MKKIALGIIFVLMAASIIPVYSIPQERTQEQINARNMLKITEMAKERVEALLGKITANSSLMNIAKPIVDNCSEMINKANNLINESINALNNGEYNEAMNKLYEAMKLLHYCFIKLYELSYELPPRAMGLMEAINNTAIRIEALNATLKGLSERLDYIDDLINEAKSLLNEAMLLLSQGNVSGAANKLGEINLIMAKINLAIKNRAQERFMLKLHEFTNKINATNSSIANSEAFRNMLKHMEKKNLKEAINSLKSLQKESSIISNFISLDINASRNGLNIKISNIGNSTLLFPNSAYGIIIERKVGNLWMLFHAPIAAQVITPLEPGKTVSIKIPIHIMPGTYRVVVKAWTEGMNNQIVTNMEFIVK
ncbi:MAG: hypothetical protein N3D72_00735 [Candidatus Methanomethyliaceae archaeon]|nr:hypothetical protein [Candidatus Methanomethyliaceae archaeon]